MAGQKTQASRDVHRGQRLPRNIGFTIIDFQKEQATIFSAYEIVYPQPTAAEIAERYDINKLSEGKR